MAPILIDTNVLVYIFDHHDERRQERALNLVKSLESINQGRFSAQCLAEFFSVVTRKLIPPLSPSEAIKAIELWMNAFPIYPLTSSIVLEAARGVRDHHLAYYDAQIWATARFNQIPLVFSEDFQDGRALEGVRFINPFSSEFNLGAWV